MLGPENSILAPSLKSVKHPSFPMDTLPPATDPSPSPDTHPSVSPPSYPLTLLILIAPALVMASFAVLPREALNSDVGTTVVLANMFLGPILAGWGAGGRLALRSRLIPGASPRSPAVLRLMCIGASYVLTFFGCAASAAANIRS